MRRKERGMTGGEGKGEEGERGLVWEGVKVEGRGERGREWVVWRGTKGGSDESASAGRDRGSEKYNIPRASSA